MNEFERAFFERVNEYLDQSQQFFDHVLAQVIYEIISEHIIHQGKGQSITHMDIKHGDKNIMHYDKARVEALQVVDPVGATVVRDGSPIDMAHKTAKKILKVVKESNGNRERISVKVHYKDS